VRATPIFPTAQPGAGMYESFYLRAVAPEEPLGVWIRYTVHKRPRADPKGSLWFTFFDARRARPTQLKHTSTQLSVPADGWIAVGGASFGPLAAEGSCGEASWSLRIRPRAPELRHLAPALLYRTPLPRTKLTSPAPAATFGGEIEIPDVGTLRIEDWPGMVGHNWGAEHAERWIWLHGLAFDGHPRSWIDLALGRVLVAGRMTPWVANGTICLDGASHRLSGISRGAGRVHESPSGCRLRLGGGRGTRVEVRAQAPTHALAGWRYADPDGGGHDVANCSIAHLSLAVAPRGVAKPVLLESDHGGAYELGMRERDHGVPIAPFAEGRDGG
jgi:hypothetical protein